MSSFITVDGVGLHYEDHGSGVPVVVLHGAASAGAALADLAGQLAERHRVILPDLRGMGRSQRVEQLAPDAWTIDLRSLVDALGIERMHLVGVSLGARILTRFAIDNPGRAITLAVDAPILANEPEGNDALARRFATLDVDAEQRERWQRLHGEDWSDVVRSYGRFRSQPALQEHLNLRSRVADLTVPLLITRGDIDDAVHPLAHCAQWHDLVPGSWLWVSPGTPFSLMIERPAEFARVHAEFLAHHADPSQE